MGSVFRMPFLYVEDLAAAIVEMKAAGIQTYAALEFAKTNTNAKLINLLKAMLKYGVATYNYAN